jgi:HK97 family phage portal protein
MIRSALLGETEKLRAEMAEYRSSLENPQTVLSFPAEWLLDAWAGGATDSGVRVSEMTALQVSTVFACVQLISSAKASLDLLVLERFTSKKKRVGRRLAYDHYLFDLLGSEPNHEMTSFTWRKSSMLHALLWGNLYTEIERNGGGQAIGLWPRNPAKTRPHRVLKSGMLVYKTSDGLDDVQIPGQETKIDGPERTIFAEDMIHVPGLAIDARLGQSVSWLSRQVIGLAMATEKFGAKLFANGARPGGVLTHPGKLTDKARATMRETWHQAQGGENQHKVAVLEDGIKFEKIAATAEEAQFLGTRDHQKLEICSIFAVPPHMIGADRAGGKNNLEQIGGEFVTFTLTPWLKAWQQELDRKLFPKTGQNAKKFFPHFETRPLIMPDASSRQAFYSAGKQWGFLSTDDILEMEHLNPTDQEGSDLYWMPTNVGVMSKDGAQIPTSPTDAGDPQTDPTADPKAKDKAPAATKIGKRLARTYSGLFEDAFRRIQARRDANSEAYKRALLPIFLTVARQIQAGVADEFNLELDSPVEESRFLVDLIEGLHKRHAEGESAEQVAERELPRVIRAIAIDVYRNMAIAVAKERTEDVTT